MSNNSKVQFRDDGTILVKDVRLSYPHLFHKWAKEGDDKAKAKFSGKFLLDKTTHAEAIKAINQRQVALQMEYFKSRIPNDKIFMRNGAELGREEMKDSWVISASESIRPEVINKDKSPIAEEDDIIYAGCFVNVLIRPWKQQNSFGKRVNANLLAVQFVKDGERFSSIERPDIDEAFEDESGGVQGAASSDDDDGLGDGLD